MTGSIQDNNYVTSRGDGRDDKILERRIVEIADELKGTREELIHSALMLDEMQEEAKRSAEELKKAKDEINNMKYQIFAVMALFFGIFTFISVDLAFVSAVFKFDNDAALWGMVIPRGIYIPMLFIVVNALFFYFINKALLKPILQKCGCKCTCDAK